MSRTINRFEILCIETAEEYLENKRIKIKELKKREVERRKKIEEEHVCESCRRDYEHLRWIDKNMEISDIDDGEMYICHECWEMEMKCYYDRGIPSEHLRNIEYITERAWDEWDD